MNIFSIKNYLLVIIICLFPYGLFAYEMEDCISCHSETPGEGIPQISAKDYRSSIHGRMMMCADCHSYIDEEHVAGDVNEKVNCGNCHSQEGLHGASSGEENKPECYSCHTKHNILPKYIKHSAINETQLKNTCKECHPAQWGEQGYLKWFTSVRVRSHKKQDFSKDFNETNCVGCHQGMAIHGKSEIVDEQNCYKCHMNNNQNGLMGTFHTGNSSGSFILGLSLFSQILILIILAYAIRFFIVKPLRKSGKGEG